MLKRLREAGRILRILKHGWYRAISKLLLGERFSSSDLLLSASERGTLSGRRT